MPVSLTDRQRRALRGRGHALKPVVQIGAAGLTPAVQAEVEQALLAHELIKVRVQGCERDERDALIERMRADCNAVLVQRIGHTALVYRPHPKRPRIKLDDPG